MKLLLHGNGPQVRTGYGVQVALLADRLASAGHEVAISATYGNQCQMLTWTSPSGHQIRVYPGGYEQHGNDVVHAHADHFFKGDTSSGWIIPILDVWALLNPVLAEFNVAAWTPVDHFPVPRDVLKFFHRTDAVPIAMSRFGERLFFEAGMDPAYIPLSVDTKAYKPTVQLEIADKGTVTGRELFGVPYDAFVVGMVAMNKGWAVDRKGFNEAFRAFGVFWKSHNDAVFLVHSEKFGAAEGINLEELAVHCGIPPHALIWTDQYAYRLGFTAEMMAALYTTMDVLLSPSHGEGFGVPLIEAQACGTPVIATDFSAQSELIGVGAKIMGQPGWDPAQHASLIVPFISEIVDALEESYKLKGNLEIRQACVEWAQAYDSDRVFEEHWLPFLATLEPPAEVIADKPLIDKVDVIVPLVRKANEQRLLESFWNTNDGTANLLFGPGVGNTYARNVNTAYTKSTADWICVVGDDVEFTAGWLDEARKLSDRYDVIGLNDSEEGRIRNPDVAAGRHADHFLIRRSYIEEEGSSLDGPGVVMPGAYRHWFTDKEVVSLAKARGVFGMAYESRVIHHHPGYDGDEEARQADPIYMLAVQHQEADQKTYRERVPLIEMQRTSRARR